MATLLRELFHDVSRRAAEIACELSKMRGTVPTEVEPYRARMERKYMETIGNPPPPPDPGPRDLPSAVIVLDGDIADVMSR